MSLSDSPRLGQSETSDRPRLLDLFAGAGGCAKGYQRAGFYVVGVDNRPQPNYCGDEFHQADALEFDLDGYDAIHASPPCQGYSLLRHRTGADYPRLIEPVRELLRATGRPYVIENVEGAPLIDPIRLCGSSFGLQVWRHRLFECSFPIMAAPCSHRLCPHPIDVTGTGGPSSRPRLSGGGLSRKPGSLTEARAAMGIDWMKRTELAEAIPPAFTTHVGRYLMAEIEASLRGRSDP
jgi:DNA (cytosine-5)-methyltransferase 1